MWYFSAAGAPENGQNVISVEKSVLYRVITPSVRKTAGFYPPTFRSEKVGRGGKNRWDSTDVCVWLRSWFLWYQSKPILKQPRSVDFFPEEAVWFRQRSCLSVGIFIHRFLDFQFTFRIPLTFHITVSAALVLISVFFNHFYECWKKRKFCSKKNRPLRGRFYLISIFTDLSYFLSFLVRRKRKFWTSSKLKTNFVIIFFYFDHLAPAAGAGSRKSVFSNYKSPFDSSQSRYRPNKAIIYNFPNIRIFPTFGFFSTFTKKFNIDCNCSVSTNVEKTGFFNI